MMATKPAESAAHQKHEDKLQIVLIGTTGSGKSATGNTILGEKKFKSMVSDQSVTLEWQREKKKIAGIEVTVIDTPGCHCTKLSHDQFIAKLKEVNDSLELPYVFLLIISANYFTPKENHTVSMLQEALGESYLSNTVIMFSHSDNLVLKSKNDFIMEGNKELQSLIDKCGSTYNFVNNRKGLRKEEIENLINVLMKVAKKNEGPQPEDNRNRETKQSDIISSETLDTQLANTCLMVLGIKGVGKSATIKSLLPGAEHAVHEECSVYSKDQMKIVECPGFDEDPGEIRDAIQRGLRVCAPGPQVILVVMRVGRFSPATKQTMQHVQSILGEAAQKHVIIVFTRKDELDGQSLEQFISRSRDLETFVTKFGSRSFALENRSADVQSQVMELKSMIRGMLKSNSHCVFTITGSQNQPVSICQGPTLSLQGGGERWCSGHEGLLVKPLSPTPWGERKGQSLDPLGQPLANSSRKWESTNQMTQSKALNTHLSANTCLMVLGIKGVGKSATIKSLLPGAEHTVHEECSVYSKDQMKIVECPGFDEDPGEIRDAIERGLHVSAPGPQVILVVMKVAQFSPATKQTMQHVQAILGEAAQKHVIIVFTRKDDSRLEQFISESRDLETFVTMFGSRSFALENRSADIQSQVMELKSMIRGMLQSNSNIIYTLPGLQMQAAHPGPTSSLSRMGEVGRSGVESSVPSSWGGESRQSHW